MILFKVVVPIRGIWTRYVYEVTEHLYYIASYLYFTIIQKKIRSREWVPVNHPT